MFDLPPSVNTTTYCKQLPTPLLAAYEPWCTSMRMRAIARTGYHYTIHDEIIVVEDLSRGGNRLANNIESVLEEIEAELGDLTSYSIIYPDIRGIWNSVLFREGVMQLHSLNETNQEQAIKRLLQTVIIK